MTGFALPDRQSQLVVEGAPEEPLAPAGAWEATIRNDGADAVVGDLAMAHMVVTDSDGVVVATVDPTVPWGFWGGEGSARLKIAGGEQLPFPVSPAFSCEEEWLPSGEYEAWVLLTVGAVGETEPSALNQAQGGPFPLVIEEDAAYDVVSLPVPDGAAAWTSPDCGDAWATPQVSTGSEIELAERIESPRTVGEKIEGPASLTTGGPMTGPLRLEALTIQDGTVVGLGGWASDALDDQYLSGGVETDLGIYSLLKDCRENPLPAGDYEIAVVAVHTRYVVGGVEEHVVAVADPVDVTLTDDPGEPATTEPTTEPPTTDPSTPPTTTPGTDPMLPECGEEYTIPDHDLAIAVGPGGSEPIAPDGSWVVEVSNEGSEAVREPIEGPFVALLRDGVVVATRETFYGPGGEGVAWLGVAPGESVDVAATVAEACDGGAVEPGEYEAVAFLRLGFPDDAVTVAVGGPWPMTIADGGRDEQVEPTELVTTPFADSCGDVWDGTAPDSDLTAELLDRIRTPRAADDDLDGQVRLTAPDGLVGTWAFTHVVVLQDGVQVGENLLGSDGIDRLSLSPGGSADLRFWSYLRGCDGEPLPPGDYDVVVVVAAQTTGERRTIAMTIE